MSATRWIVFRECERGATWAHPLEHDEDFTFDSEFDAEAAVWRESIGLPRRFGFVLPLKAVLVAGKSEAEAILRAEGMRWTYGPGVDHGEAPPCIVGTAHTWQRGSVPIPPGYMDLLAEHGLPGSYGQRWSCSSCGARKLERWVVVLGGRRLVKVMDYPNVAEETKAEWGIA